MSRLVYSLITAIFMASIGQYSFAASPQSKESSIKITSKRINLTRKTGKINFIDNVIAERDDVSFLADKMVVYYQENNKNNKRAAKNKKQQSAPFSDQSKITKIEAFDKVKVFNEDFVTTGEYGFYDPETESFIVKKNVIFNNGTSVAKGDKFVYNFAKRQGKLIGKEVKKGFLGIGEEVIDNRVMIIFDDNQIEDLRD